MPATFFLDVNDGFPPGPSDRRRSAETSRLARPVQPVRVDVLVLLGPKCPRLHAPQ